MTGISSDRAPARRGIGSPERGLLAETVAVGAWPVNGGRRIPSRAPRLGARPRSASSRLSANGPVRWYWRVVPDFGSFRAHLGHPISTRPDTATPLISLPMHGQFVRYELTTPDADSAQKFYPR